MCDRKTLRSCWISTLLITAAAGGLAAAQEVKDLTRSNPTEDQLIAILQPKQTEEDGARGIGMAQPRPKCIIRREEGGRGIGYHPISDVAAIRVGFDYDSAEILPEAMPALDILGRALTSPRLASSCFQIKGHTDSIGSDSYNDQLSQRRAEAVRQYLATHFDIEPDRLDALGLGKTQPIDDNATPEGRSHNRRVEIVNVGS